MLFQLSSKYRVGKVLSQNFFRYLVAHARDIFHSFIMNEDNFCSSCSSIFLTRVQNWIIIYDLLGLLSLIFDRAEILTAERILEMIDRPSFKILKCTGKINSLEKLFHRLIDFSFFSGTKNILCSISWRGKIIIFIQMVFYDQFYIIVCNYALNPL